MPVLPSRMSTLSEIEAAVTNCPKRNRRSCSNTSPGNSIRSIRARQQRRGRGLNANAGCKGSTGCGTRALPARRGCHSRRSSTISVLSVADELLTPIGMHFRPSTRQPQDLRRVGGSTTQREKSQKITVFIVIHDSQRSEKSVLKRP